MTQNKNKKGIAKKALSISLVAAMLATSNVPVWASGFEAVDPAEGFAVEAAAPETEAVENEPVVDFDDSVSTQADAWNQGCKSTIIVTAPAWNKTPTVTGGIYDENGKEYKDFHYEWRVDGRTRNGGHKEASTSINAINAPALTSDDCGKSLTLVVTKYVDSDPNKGRICEFTINADQAIQKVNLTDQFQNNTGETGTIKFFTGNYDVEYDGTEHKQLPEFSIRIQNDPTVSLKSDEFEYSYSCTAGTNNFTDAGKVTVTAVPKNTKLYSGSLVDSYRIYPKNYSDEIKAKLKDPYKAYEYTGESIEIPLEDIALYDTINDRNQDISSALVGIDKAGISVGTHNSDTEVWFDTTLVTNYDFSGRGVDQDDLYGYVMLDSYKIVARDLSKCTVEIDPIAYEKGVVVTTNDARFRNKVHVYDENGKELKLDTGDYSIVVTGKPKNPGTYEVSIEGKGKTATGIVAANFAIIDETFDGAKFTNYKYAEASEPYTGEVATKDIAQLGDLLDKDKNAISPNLYDITFEGVDAGNDTGRIVITGKSSYEGAKLVIPFDITPATVETEDVTAVETIVFDPSFNSAADYKPAVTVKAHNDAAPPKEFTLTEGTDYKVTYSFTDTSDGNVVGSEIQAKIQILNPNFLGGGSRFVNADNQTVITKKQLGVTVTAEPSSYTYTGETITPTLKVMDGSEELYEGVDYEIVNVANGINVGTATATIHGLGQYDADSYATVDYTITPADISDVKVTTTADVVYNGKPVKPDPDDIEITLNGVDVKEQIRISFPTASIDAGKGVMTLTPGTNTKNFTGTTTAEYVIHPATLRGRLEVFDKNGNKIDVEKEKFTYEGKEFTFADAVFTPSGEKADLVTEDDYEITYIDNKYGPSAYICVIGKNNFAGSAQIVNAENEVVKSVVAGTAYKFTIEPYEIKEQHVTIGDAEYAGGVAVTPDVKVVISGRTLVEGEDYVLDYASVSDLTDGKTLKVTVKGINGYTGSVTENVAVVKKDIANCEIIVEGNNVTVMNGKVVVPSSEYTVSWADETVTVTAASDSKYYEGSQTVDRDIIAAPGNTVMSVSDRTTSTVTVNWEKVDDAEGYTIWYRSEYDTKMSRHIVKGNDTTSWTVKGLQPGTKYFFSARAWVQDDEGNYVFSEEQSPTQRGTTKPLAAKIIGVSVEKGKIKVRLAGEAAGAEMYSMCYGDARTSFADNDFKVGIRTQYTTRTLTPTFEPGTYYVCVKSYRDLGNNKRVYGAWSNTFRAVVK